MLRSTAGSIMYAMSYTSVVMWCHILYLAVVFTCVVKYIRQVGILYYFSVYQGLDPGVLWDSQSLHIT